MSALLRCLAGTAGVLCTCLLLGCAKPPYLLRGLTLPPGSSVASETSGTWNGGTNPAFPMPMNLPGLPSMNNVKYVQVSFDNSGGWNTVSSHFDSTLGAKGYVDTFATLGQLAGSTQSDPLMGSMRMYSKPESKFMVMLGDMGGMMARAGQSLPSGPAGGTQVPGFGTYNLMVMQSR